VQGLWRRAESAGYIVRDVWYDDDTGNVQMTFTRHCNIPSVRIEVNELASDPLSSEALRGMVERAVDNMIQHREGSREPTDPEFPGSISVNFGGVTGEEMQQRLRDLLDDTLRELMHNVIAGSKR
jgi:hypothetical protein